MAKPSSERVMRQRKRDNDRISFVVDKDVKYLYHAQALREGVTMGEMVRRAVLARCGIDSMPDVSSVEYQRIIDAKDQESAKKAIRTLQIQEYYAVESSKQHRLNRGVYYTAYMPGEKIKDEAINALYNLLDEVKKAPAQHETKIRLHKKEWIALKRLMANIEEIPEYPDSYED